MVDTHTTTSKDLLSQTNSSSTSNTIKRKFMPKETHEVLRGTDSNYNEIINQYTVLDELGEGAYSKVKLFFDNNNKKYFATKIINKKELEKKKKGIKKREDGRLIVDTCLKDALREIAILKRIECKNIVQLREIIHEDANSRIYLVMELAEKGSILDYDNESCRFYINNSILNEDNNRDEAYSEEEIKDFMRGIVFGINYCK